MRPDGSFPPVVAKFRERLSRAQAFLTRKIAGDLLVSLEKLARKLAG